MHNIMLDWNGCSVIQPSKTDIFLAIFTGEKLLRFYILCSNYLSKF